MTITFSRSGGLAAVPGLSVRALVTIEAHRGRVQSDGYTRDIGAPEADALARDAAAAVAERREGAQPESRSRDAFCYQFWIVLDDGEVEELSTADDKSPESATGRLVAWARNEASLIIARR